MFCSSANLKLGLVFGMILVLVACQDGRKPNTTSKKGKKVFREDSIVLLADELSFTFRRQTERKQLIDSLERSQGRKPMPEENTVIEGTALPQLTGAPALAGTLPLQARLLGADPATGFLQVLLLQDSTLLAQAYDSRRQRWIGNPRRITNDCLEAQNEALGDNPYLLPAHTAFRVSDTLMVLGCRVEGEPQGRVVHRGKTYYYDGFEILDVRYPHVLLRASGDLYLARLDGTRLSHLVFSGSGLLCPERDSLLACDYGYDYEQKQFVTEAFWVSLRDRGFRSAFTLRHPRYTLRAVGWDPVLQQVLLADEVNHANEQGLYRYSVPTATLEQVATGMVSDLVYSPAERSLYYLRAAEDIQQVLKHKLP
jgi:hypothetical protein